MRFFGALALCVIAWSVVVVCLLTGFSPDNVSSVAIGAFAAIWIFMNGIVFLYDFALLLRSYHTESFHLVGDSAAENQITYKHTEIFLVPTILLGFVESLLSLAYFRKSSGRSQW